MRPALRMPLVLALLAAACSPGDCLPEPESDATPPELELAVDFTDPGGSAATAQLDAQGPAQSIRARADAPVQVRYVARDAAGLRRLQLGLTEQQTVGTGVQQKSRLEDPITASCPRPELAGSVTIPATGKRRDVVLGAVAESWAGDRTSLPPHVLRLEKPSEEP